MELITTLQDIALKLETRLQLNTYSFGVKFIENEKKIPEDAVRPRKDLGKRLMLCQAFAMTRRENTTIAMLKQDHYCISPFIAMGHSSPPFEVLNGEMIYPKLARTREAAKKLVAKTPRLGLGKYLGIVSMPLHKIIFKPDLIIFYCNVSQLRDLLEIIQYTEGYQVETTLESGDACIYSTVAPFTSGECKLTVPCSGDKGFAMARDDEVIFTITKRRINDFIVGSQFFLEKDLRQPLKYAMNIEPPLPDDFIRIGKNMGMDF